MTPEPVTRGLATRAAGARDPLTRDPVTRDPVTHGAVTRSLLAEAGARLAAAGVASPDHDATELLAHLLGVSRAALPVHVDAETVRRLGALLDQRADRVPLQHLTGSAGFRYLDLAVGPGVFVPRPETELLAGWAIARLAGVPAPVVVDLCTGSGAIALSIAHELTAAEIYAVELDPLAVAWAQRNADNRTAAGDRPVTLLTADATDPGLLAELDGRVDAVLANPPYVPIGARVEPEVAEHDPALALWGGPDGLEVIRRLTGTASRLLAPGGVLALEHADVQGDAVPDLLRAAGYLDVEDHADLAGRPRFSTGVRRADRR